MVVEGILIAVALTWIGFGLFIGYGLGRRTGERTGYRRGFDHGVDFARNRRRQTRGNPLHSHLRAVD